MSKNNWVWMCGREMDFGEEVWGSQSNCREDVSGGIEMNVEILQHY